MSCPICAKPAAERYRPFCSRRCADIDLGRWLRGSYAIPTDDAPDAGSQDPGGAAEANGAAPDPGRSRQDNGA